MYFDEVMIIIVGCTILELMWDKVGVVTVKQTLLHLLLDTSWTTSPAKNLHMLSDIMPLSTCVDSFFYLLIVAVNEPKSWDVRRSRDTLSCSSWV